MTVIVQQPTDSNGNPQPMVYDQDTGKIIVDHDGYYVNGGKRLVNVPTVSEYVSTPKTQTAGIQEAYSYLKGIMPIVTYNNNLLIKLSADTSDSYVINKEIQFDSMSVDIVSDGRLAATIRPSSTFSGSYLFNLGSSSVSFDGIIFEGGNSSVGYFENSNAITEDITFDYHWHNCYFGASPFNAFNFNNISTTSRYEFFDSQFALDGGSGGNFGLNGAENGTPLIFIGCDFSVPSGNYLFNLGAIAPYVIACYAHVGGGTSNEAIFNLTNSSNCAWFDIYGLQLMDTYTYLFNAQSVTNAGRLSKASIYGVQSSNLFLGSVIADLILQLKTDQLNTNPNTGITGFVDSLSPSLSANPPVSGTVYQNTNTYDIEIDLPVYATTAGTAGYVTIAKGSSSSSLTTIGSQFVNGSTSSTSVDIIRLRVPAGWYYEFTGSGVTFGTASVFAE